MDSTLTDSQCQSQSSKKIIRISSKKKQRKDEIRQKQNENTNKYSIAHKNKQNMWDNNTPQIYTGKRMKQIYANLKNQGKKKCRRLTLDYLNSPNNDEQGRRSQKISKQIQDIDRHFHESEFRISKDNEDLLLNVGWKNNKRQSYEKEDFLQNLSQCMGGQTNQQLFVEQLYKNSEEDDESVASQSRPFYMQTSRRNQIYIKPQTNVQLLILMEKYKKIGRNIWNGVKMIDKVISRKQCTIALLHLQSSRFTTRKQQIRSFKTKQFYYQ